MFSYDILYIYHITMIISDKKTIMYHKEDKSLGIVKRFEQIVDMEIAT